MRRAIPGLVLASLLPAVLIRPALGVELTLAERERLSRGETLVRMEAVAGRALRDGVALRVVAASPERLFRAVADCAHYAEFMPFATSSAAERGPDGGPRARLVIDAPLGSRRLTVACSAEGPDGGAEPVWRAGWRYVPGSGDVTEHRGDWELTAWPAGGTLIVLRLASDSGLPVWAENRATEKTLPWILDGLRQHVGRCRYDEPRAPTCTE